MNVAYFDIVSGISGDMTLGAFVSAGVSFERLQEELRKLPLKGYSISRRTLMRSMVATVKIDVTMDSGGHEHHHRGFNDIRDIIASSTLAESIKERAIAMFLTLAEAEATVHGTTVEKIHFHEVGAVDSIVDIVGVAICMELLGIERVYTSRVRTGSGGFIETQHGRMPVPAPATVEILKDYAVELTDIPHELTTPTGATIVATLSSGLLAPDTSMKITSIGYGAGGKEIPGTPNMLRLLVGRIENHGQEDTLLLFETNIDDMNPEMYPWVIDRMLDAGANDAWVTPMLMKKGRPAMLLSVLAAEDLRDRVLSLLYTQTTTSGVREHTVRRHKLPRTQRLCHTRYGDVTAKVLGTDAMAVPVPEFEECRRIALEHNLPLIQVYREIQQDLANL